MKHIIEVTREDLKGRYQDSTDCPIARALKRTFKTDDIFVGVTLIKMCGKVYWDAIPKSASMKAYNRAEGKFMGKALGGFKFTIDV